MWGGRGTAPCTTQAGRDSLSSPHRLRPQTCLFQKKHHSISPALSSVSPCPTCVPRGWLYDGVPRLQDPSLLSILHHPEADAVLHAAPGVEELTLGHCKHTTSRAARHFRAHPAPPPVLTRDTFHQNRLPQASSNLALKPRLAPFPSPSLPSLFLVSSPAKNSSDHTEVSLQNSQH